jgi:hypothetical protein
MPIKCTYKPRRSKPRLFKRCDAARIAGKAMENDSLEAVLGAVAGRLGLSVVMIVPENTDNVLNDQLEIYRKLLDGYIQQFERLILKADDLLQIHIDKINDVLQFVPDFLVNDTGIGVIDWALDLIRLAYRRIMMWLDFLYKIRDELQTWSDDLAEILRFLQDLREFLANVSDLSNSKPVYSGDYSC